MSEPTFTIGLDDLRAVCDAVCEVDGLQAGADRRITDKITAAHDAIIRTLGDQAHLVYAPSDGSEEQEPA